MLTGFGPALPLQDTGFGPALPCQDIGFVWHQKYNFGMFIKHVSIFEYNKLPHLWCWKTKNNLISQWSDLPTSICWTSKKNLISQWWATWLSLSTKKQNILLWSSKYTHVNRSWNARIRTETNKKHSTLHHIRPPNPYLP